MKQNPKEFDWVPATKNSDTTSIQPGEITGYQIGIRSLTAAGSAPGTYPITIMVNSPTATKELLSDAYATGLALLKPDQYVPVVRSVGPVNSDWTAEDITNDAFEITPPPPPKPNPPTGFSVA